MARVFIEIGLTFTLFEQASLPTTYLSLTYYLPTTYLLLTTCCLLWLYSLLTTYYASLLHPLLAQVSRALNKQL